MKRLLAILLAMVLFVGIGAVAEPGNGSIGDMLVVNCEEWVSLRSKPNSRSERLIKVPLDAVVQDCFWYSDEFIYGTYQGLNGYILANYLLEVNAENANVVLEGNGWTVLGFRSYKDSAECMNLICRDYTGNILWQRMLQAPYATELSCTDAFIAGTAEDEMVMAHVSGVGLMALSPETGEAIWTLDESDVSLGGSISAAVDAEGNMYIGGYYGPDPVAISKDGEILWCSDAGDDFLWLYDVIITDEALIAYYEYAGDSDSTGSILYDWNGEVVWKSID